MLATLLLGAPGLPQRQTVPDRVPPKRSSQIHDGFGVNTPMPREPYLPWSRRWWTRIFDAGIKFARIGQYENSTDYTSWDCVEQKRGVYAIPQEVDDYVSSLADNGVAIELQLLYGNGMYTSPAGRLPDSILPPLGSAHPPDRGLYSVFWAPTTPEQIRAFNNYVRWTVDHFRGRVQYYEIWNEPSEYFWNPQPSPGAYAALAREVISTVHETDPKAKVVFGAFGLTEREFPRQAIEACRCADGIDVFSYHTYPDFGRNLNPEALDEPAHAKESPALLREMVRKLPAIRGDIAFWNDEFNSPPSWEDSDESVQAKYIAREMVYDRAAGVRTFVWELIPGVDGNQGDDYGLTHGMMMRPNDFTPRPAFQALQNVNALFSDATVDSSIGVTVPELTTEKPQAPFLAYGFRSRTGKAIIAYWLAARSLPGGNGPYIHGDLKIRNAGIVRPVLIDVLSGRVTALSWKIGRDDTLESLPFRDSVMAVADESFFDWPVLPAAPALLRFTLSGGRVRLAWDLFGQDVVGVVIERREGEQGEWKRAARLHRAITERTDSPRGLALNVYYRVRAINDAGESAYSNIVKVRVKKSQ